MTIDMAVETTWRVIVPLKDTMLAKSRLGGGQSERRELAIAMARDTLEVVVGTPNVVQVVAACSSAEDVEAFTMPGVSVLVFEGLGLNETIRAAETQLRAADKACNLAVVPGDLPHLRAGELAVALNRAVAMPAARVSDRFGTGTTLLTSWAGRSLDPAYGEGSASAHQRNGVDELEIPVWSGLRRDVDTASDLALHPSLGDRTRAVLVARAEPTKAVAV